MTRRNSAIATAATQAAITVTIAGSQSLTLTIADTGTSAYHGQWKPGVGIESMQERAEQIGRTLTTHTGPAGATVTPALPLTVDAMLGEQDNDQL